MASGENPSGSNYEAAQETYAGFTNLLKYGTIATAVVTIFVVLLIAS